MAVQVVYGSEGAVDSDTIDEGHKWTHSDGFLVIFDEEGEVVATYKPSYWLSVMKVEDDND